VPRRARHSLPASARLLRDSANVSLDSRAKAGTWWLVVVPADPFGRAPRCRRVTGRLRVFAAMHGSTDLRAAELRCEHDPAVGRNPRLTMYIPDLCGPPVVIGSGSQPSIPGLPTATIPR
jgi:hypothetical protein